MNARQAVYFFAALIFVVTLSFFVANMIGLIIRPL